MWRKFSYYESLLCLRDLISESQTSRKFYTPGTTFGHGERSPTKGHLNSESGVVQGGEILALILFIYNEISYAPNSNHFVLHHKLYFDRDSVRVVPGLTGSQLSHQPLEALGLALRAELLAGTIATNSSIWIEPIPGPDEKHKAHIF